MRLLSPLAVALAAAFVAPAAAAPAGPPTTVLLVADVGENVQRSMPKALWRQLAADYVGSRKVILEEGTVLPDAARCRDAHVTYAVLATFDRATRLPGFAHDTDRAYGIARFTVRNCVTGTVSPTKTLRVESDPLPPSDRGELEVVGERTWERAIRRALSREPLVLNAVARVVRIENGVLFLESADRFALHQLLRDFADPTGKPHPPIELVVLDMTGKFVQAGLVGAGSPHVGDYVEAVPN
ncbi:MAG: hypothetical protein JWO66_58 [Candidatus Eremiobacteraeota bacterium]|nr:hypothetical protein [Candidatus Eremiobacteraeota bacterium]